VAAQVKPVGRGRGRGRRSQPIAQPCGELCGLSCLHRVREASQETVPPRGKRITVQVGTSSVAYLAGAERVGGRQRAALVMAAQK